MCQPYVHTESILVVHRTMVDEELQRLRPERRQDAPGAIRRVVGRGLIALGARLDPAMGQSPAAFPSLGAQT